MSDAAAIAELKALVRTSPLPRHVAVIMDGNGRWAQLRGLPRIEGHRQGSESVRAVTRTARELDIEALTLYAFSSQNWQRPDDEVASLMELLREYLVKERGEIMENDIRLAASGDLDRLPSFVRAPLEALCCDSEKNRHVEPQGRTRPLSVRAASSGPEPGVGDAAQRAGRGRSGEVEIGPEGGRGPSPQGFTPRR